MFTIKHDIKDRTDDLHAMCYYYRWINVVIFLDWRYDITDGICLMDLLLWCAIHIIMTEYEAPCASMGVIQK